MVPFKPAAGIDPVPRAVSPRTVRKVALCGSHSRSLADAPWSDPSWEFWGHASSRAWYSRAMDRYFDLHVPACWTRGGKKTALYPQWLAKNTTPIYMQEHFPAVPASIKYPRGRILTEFSYAHRRQYFTNHVAWMVALAITEGVSHIALYGINYGSESEYARQRGSAEYWIGQCDARGISVYLPEQCTLLADPAILYGYDSHDKATGKLVAAYRRKEWKSGVEGAEIKPLVLGTEPPPLVAPPPEIADLIALEEKEYPRPEWALGPVDHWAPHVVTAGLPGNGHSTLTKYVSADTIGAERNQA